MQMFINNASLKENRAAFPKRLERADSGFTAGNCLVSKLASQLRSSARGGRTAGMRRHYHNGPAGSFTFTHSDPLTNEDGGAEDVS